MPKPERQVLVCVNARPPGHPKGSCSHSGSDALYDSLKDMVRERGLTILLATPTFLLAYMRRAPARCHRC